MENENNAAGAVETPTVEQLQASLSKAEAKIVDMKKAASTQETSSNENEENKEEAKPESFWKEQVEKLIKEALKTSAIENQENEYKANQNETNSMSTWNEDAISNSWFKSKSVSEYSSMTPSAQREYMKESNDKTWEVVFADEG